VSYQKKFKIALKAARQLGFQQVWWYGYYQFGLHSGLFRRLTPAKKPINNHGNPSIEISPVLATIPEREQLTKVIGEEAAALFAEANEIGNGKVRLFGGPPRELNLLVSLPLDHWTRIAVDENKAGVEDIKYIWEPARFTWVFTLVRAYQLSKDDTYPEIFWREFEAFADINLTNLGPNWVSSQEVAFRLIDFVFAYQVFQACPASTLERTHRLSAAVADHAARIPPTLAYARAQNNNHLLAESAGLITAAEALPDHPRATKWRELGLRWFNRAIQSQISTAGTYVQHSTNYHRLMLQLGLWVHSLVDTLPEASLQRLAAGTEWLSGLVDSETGRTQNLGHNDGAYFLPLSSCAFHDYRPVVQAASLAFLGKRRYPPGLWDEFALWIGLNNQASGDLNEPDESPGFSLVTDFPGSHVVLRNNANQTKAQFRVTNFTTRPAHADQLHLDLSWRGLSIAQDAGSYLYNAPSPWDNSLAKTEIHNTVTIENRDQMTRAGRFLWLDWAQAQLIHRHIAEDEKSFELIAQHDGYRSIGVLHRRAVTSDRSGMWLIEDTLFPAEEQQKVQTNIRPEFNRGKEIFKARLHWLLPDWSWEIEESETNYQTSLRLRSPHGWLVLLIGIEPATNEGSGRNVPSRELVRGGENLLGPEPVSPISGWVAPTYGYKIPVLSFAITMESPLPILFRSQWTFPPV
jgi:hypothetical protein